MFPDAVEMHPCVIAGNDAFDNPVMEQCDESDPAIACWAVYWHYEGRGLAHIKDFATKDEAANAEALLETALEALLAA